MHRFYFILISGLLLTACQPSADVNKAKQAEAFNMLESLLPTIELGSGDTLDCSELNFGPMVSGGPSVLPIKHIQNSIPAQYQEAAGFRQQDSDDDASTFDSLSIYYGLGKMSFGENKTAVLIGRHRTERKYSAHLFVFDQVKKEIINTQSLQFVLEGGNYRGSRNAWLTDINSDGTPDVIYNFSANFDSEDPNIAYTIDDSIHAEVWTGDSFADMELDNPNVIREALGLDPVEEGTAEDSGEFF